MPAEKAIEDFRSRIAQYEKTYETIDEDHLSYIKLIDVGRTIVANNIDSYIAGRVVFFLMNLHIGPRPIYISRHGQSIFNTLGKIGGNSDITDLGDKYARKLADWLEENTSASDEIVVWTSTLKRCECTTESLTLTLTPPTGRSRRRSTSPCQSCNYDPSMKSTLAVRSACRHSAHSPAQIVTA